MIDSNILNQIVKVADINKNDCVLEIGPGIGSLTQLLTEAAQKVIAVEVDNKLIPILNDLFKDCNNIEILNEDILKTDINKIIEENNNNYIKVVANLPYYITTPIIMKLLENNLKIKTITVMVQKEVAKRMIAVAGTKDYGILSLSVQYYCMPQIMLNVKPNCFIPKPKVDSSVINLKVLNKPCVEVEKPELLFKIIKIAFSQRRKTLLNCLNNSDINLSKDKILEVIKNCGFDEKIRGEALTLQQFALLCNKIYQRSENQ